jgi:oxalate decarboxylase/phosphoglucose isomerase-like protein (cupin superfamily)
VFDLAEQDLGIRCVQYAGDVVLAPPYWGHLTYNLATSIGMAKEFSINPPPQKIVDFTQMKKRGTTTDKKVSNARDPLNNARDPLKVKKTSSKAKVPSSKTSGDKKQGKQFSKNKKSNRNN